MSTPKYMSSGFYPIGTRFFVNGEFVLSVEGDTITLSNGSRRLLSPADEVTMEPPSYMTPRYTPRGTLQGSQLGTRAIGAVLPPRHGVPKDTPLQPIVFTPASTNTNVFVQTGQQPVAAQRGTFLTVPAARPLFPSSDPSTGVLIGDDMEGETNRAAETFDEELIEEEHIPEEEQENVFQKVEQTDDQVTLKSFAELGVHDPTPEFAVAELRHRNTMNADVDILVDYLSVAIQYQVADDYREAFKSFLWDEVMVVNINTLTKTQFGQYQQVVQAVHALDHPADHNDMEVDQQGAGPSNAAHSNQEELAEALQAGLIAGAQAQGTTEGGRAGKQVMNPLNMSLDDLEMDSGTYPECFKKYQPVDPSQTTLLKKRWVEATTAMTKCAKTHRPMGDFEAYWQGFLSDAEASLTNAKSGCISAILRDAMDQDGECVAMLIIMALEPNLRGQIQQRLPKNVPHTLSALRSTLEMQLAVITDVDIYHKRVVNCRTIKKNVQGKEKELVVYLGGDNNLNVFMNRFTQTFTAYAGKVNFTDPVTRERAEMYMLLQALPNTVSNLVMRKIHEMFPNRDLPDNTATLIRLAGMVETDLTNSATAVAHAAQSKKATQDTLDKLAQYKLNAGRGGRGKPGRGRGGVEKKTGYKQTGRGGYGNARGGGNGGGRNGNQGGRNGGQHGGRGGHQGGRGGHQGGRGGQGGRSDSKPQKKD
jgi:hypothetical protein